MMINVLQGIYLFRETDANLLEVEDRSVLTSLLEQLKLLIYTPRGVIELDSKLAEGMGRPSRFYGL